MKTIMFAAFAALSVQPAQSATITQTFDGSYNNRFTRDISKTYGLFDAVKSTKLTQGYQFVDRSAPGGTFDRFDTSLGVLEGVTLTYERLGGLNDSMLLRSSGCTTVFGVNCTREVSVQAALGYGFETSLPDDFRTTRQSFIGLSDPVRLTSSISFQRPAVFSRVVDDLADLAQFEGLGTFNVTPIFDLQMINYTDCDALGVDELQSCESQIRMQYSSDYRITLNYIFDEVVAPPPPPPIPSAVPLPAGAPLLLAGLGVLAFMRRTPPRP